MLEIPLNKELTDTANCLVETCSKLEELISAAMVKYGLNRVQLPLYCGCSISRLMVSSWYGLSWVIVVSEHL